MLILRQAFSPITECSNIEEAMEKLRRGQYIMIREGTAAKNMEALMPLFREPLLQPLHAGDR